MLKLTKTQRMEFSQSMRRDFESRMGWHLVRNFPTQVAALTPDALASSVRQALTETAAHGIRLEYDARRFIEHLILHGRDFIGSPRVRAILSDPQLDGTTKMDLVDELEVFEGTS